MVGPQALLSLTEGHQKQQQEACGFREALGRGGNGRRNREEMQGGKRELVQNQDNGGTAK